MKQPGILFGLIFFFWQFNFLAAIAQNPYHCDTLKVTCSSEEKIRIRYFNAPKTCPATCEFCQTISKQHWLQLETLFKKQIKALRTSPEQLENLRNWLLAHRLVNFVLPALPNQDTQMAYMQIGFQVPHMTFAWNAAFKLKPSRKAKPAYWKVTNFESDSHIYGRLNALGTRFHKLLQSDSLKLPEPWLPDQNYLASWFGTRSPTDLAELENLIQTNPREAVKTLIEKKDGLALVFMLAHENLAIRYLALQGIKTIQDKNCLPHLLYLAERTRHTAVTAPETEILYANFLEQLVSTIISLTDCGFNRCPFAHYPPQHYLTLGLPTWQSKLDHQDPNNQGIGMYATLLDTK